MFYLIEKYWYDPMENRNYDGWKPYAISNDVVKVSDWCRNENHFIPVSESEWPLKHSSHKKNDKVALYRYTQIKKL